MTRVTMPNVPPAAAAKSVEQVGVAERVYRPNPPVGCHDFGFEEVRRPGPELLGQAAEAPALDEARDANGQATAALHITAILHCDRVIDPAPDCSGTDRNAWIAAVRDWRALRKKGVVQLYRLHAPGPHQQRIGGIGIAVIAVPSALHDQLQLMLARNIDGSGNVCGAFSGYRHQAGLGGPGVNPAERLGERGFVAEIIGVLKLLEERIGACSAGASGGDERRTDRDQPVSDAAAKFVPGCGGRCRGSDSDGKSCRRRAAEQPSDKGPSFHAAPLFFRHSYSRETGPARAMLRSDSHDSFVIFR